MLELNNINIKKRDNNQMLLKDFNLLLNKNDKCAIIGEEGNGKSTLLKALSLNSFEHIILYPTAVSIF